MKNKCFLVLIGSYLLAFSINLMPAMKYPDLHIDLLDLGVSLVYMFFLFIYARKGMKGFRIFLLLGIVSGVVIFLSDGIMAGNGIWDVLANIHYPFYFIFTTPLFGGNYLFNISHEAYSLVLSLLYAIVFGITLYFEKRRVQTE